MPSRIPTRGVKMPPHPNNFVMRKDLFWEMGGYIETRIGRDYPQGEDRLFKKRWMQFVGAGKAAGADYRPMLYMGKAAGADYRPMLYMFPNGQFCGDVDYNPHGLFHNLSRRKND
jgi:hypothetical protein